ncbi:hypothetical protein BpHYR1_032487 [Brachionus plicatilis]|uniref:Uncharacterized protein n=1 Tax=Brachionus plicatilis TaxID=10195 RepID=A0A3M7QKF9_BRAPC|nr:hypothetical protein BpHYR1_032487 [Brachionus plicatilis]
MIELKRTSQPRQSLSSEEPKHVLLIVAIDCSKGCTKVSNKVNKFKKKIKNLVLEGDIISIPFMSNNSVTTISNID